MNSREMIGVVTIHTSSFNAIVSRPKKYLILKTPLDCGAMKGVTESIEAVPVNHSICHAILNQKETEQNKYLIFNFKNIE